MDQVSVLVLVPIVSLAGGWLGAYFGAYFREKGKNLATREDIDRITRATEDIKADISGDLWERQNRWMFKKDLYIRLLLGLGDAASAVRQILFLDERLHDPAHKALLPQTEQFINNYFSELRTAMVEIRRSAFIAPLVCTEATERALERLLEEWLKAEEEQKGPRQYVEGCRTALSTAIESLTNAAREDLRLVSSEAKRPESTERE